MARLVLSTSTMRAFILVVLTVLTTVLTTVSAQNANNLDQFNYDVTDSDARDFGPRDWQNVRCGNSQTCLGWPESWDLGIEWELQENSCKWCPAGTTNGSCDIHHQSPINLQRNRALTTSAFYNECQDKHWMAYHDSSCSFDDLVDKNAFSIERHALKINQPVRDMGNDVYEVDCNGNGGSRFGRIDFSKGFSDWWHLSHMDFHVPSEHTQEGKRYDGELQMYHFYSISGTEAKVDNQMATVTVFLEAYDNAPDWDVLNKVLCQWRVAEERTRDQCGLPSVEEEYPGCFYYQRGHSDPVDPIAEQFESYAGFDGQRHLQNMEPSMSAHDLFMYNYEQAAANVTYTPRTLNMKESDHAPDDPDIDWDAFIKDQYTHDHVRKNNRKLVNYDHVAPWHNYFPLLDVRTEYYYRYEGTQTIPPCYGRFFSGADRGSTNHWRIMKDPMRVSQRQIDEMNRLLARRIAPPTDPLRPCEPDTAGKVDPVDTSKVNVARPLQSFSRTHRKVFCECQDWKSKWVEDQEWCRQSPQDRYYKNPYNFAATEF